MAEKTTNDLINIGLTIIEREIGKIEKASRNKLQIDISSSKVLNEYMRTMILASKDNRAEDALTEEELRHMSTAELKALLDKQPNPALPAAPAALISGPESDDV